MKKLLVIYLFIFLCFSLPSCDGFGGTNGAMTEEPSHEHNYSEIKIENPTCTEGGYTAFVCDCGDSFIDTYHDPIGHSLGEWEVIKAPTQTEEGLWERYCVRCNEKESKVIPLGLSGSLGLEYESHWHPNKGVYYSVSGIGTCTDENVFIPATHDGCPVVSVYNLQDCIWIKSITIQDGVETIGGDAFRGCTSLVSVEVPNSVKGIGYSAFSHCSSLEYINLPNDLALIERGMFSYCTSLKSISIPEAVTTIESSAFEGCTLFENIIIPDSVTIIEQQAFYGCSSLKNVVLSNNISEIGINLFAGCSSLESIVIPNSVTAFRIGAFSNCTSLKEIVFGNGLTVIENSAFNKCRSLVRLDIPDGVMEIGNNAFGLCNSLVSVTIPNSVKNIDFSAFSKCPSLENISVSDDNESYASVDGVLYTKDKKTLILCPKGKNIISIVLPEGLEIINKYAFNEVRTLESIEIPNSVNKIEMYAFRLCENLLTITFKGTLEEWQKIEKISGWDNGNSKYTIYCTDGQISWQGEVTAK